MAVEVRVGAVGCWRMGMGVRGGKCGSVERMLRFWVLMFSFHDFFSFSCPCCCRWF